MSLVTLAITCLLSRITIVLLDVIPTKLEELNSLILVRVRASRKSCIRKSRLMAAWASSILEAWFPLTLACPVLRGAARSYVVEMHARIGRTPIHETRLRKTVNPPILRGSWFLPRAHQRSRRTSSKLMKTPTTSAS